MPTRISVPNFIGGTDVRMSDQASNERLINAFVETVQRGQKTQRYIRKAEGLNPFTVLAGSDTSVLFAQDDRAFAVCGSYFYEFYEDGSHALWGTVAYDGTRASIVSNGSAGNELCICSGGVVYIFDLVTSTFVTVTDLTGIYITMLEFMDGYFFGLERDSRRVYFSKIEDGLTWDTTFDYFERSWGSDNVSFLKRSGRQLWVVGTQTSEVWADVGNATQPFAPIQGAFLDVGCESRNTGARDGETISWLARDERGGHRVVRATGYSPQDISSYPIASVLDDPSSDADEMEAFVHQLQGHVFYWLYIPGADTTPVYDFTEQTWHERARWNSAQVRWEPHIARSHCYVWNKHFVGTRTTGVIYELAPEYVENRLTS